MTGTPLLIGPVEKAQLERLRRLAARHPVDLPIISERVKTADGRRLHMQQMRRQTIYLPEAYAVTFSIDIGHPVGPVRHLSMSVKHQGRAPNQHAIWMVAEELGFTGRLEDCSTIWIEDLEDGRKAINVIQPLNVVAAATDTVPAKSC